MNTDEVLKQQDKFMQYFANRHNWDNPRHKMAVYGNFVHCDTCQYHAHTHGLELIHHNKDYSINEIIPFEPIPF